MSSRYGWNRKIKAIAAWLMVTIFCLGGMMPAFAAEEQRVYDDAGLFTAAQIEAFEETIAQYRKELGVDIVVLTTDDAQGKDGQSYADDYYEAGGFGKGSKKSGILFLIDMDNRELVLSTDGECIRIFTDARIESILDDTYEGAVEGDYAASVEAFLEDARYYVKKGIVAGQYNYDTETGAISVYKSIRWYEALLAFAVSFIVAGGACLNVKRQYKMEPTSSQKNNLNMAYRADSKFAFYDRNDVMVNSYVTTQVIPKKTTSSGGRSSGGGSRSSSTRSSTHRSSSGRSHGGGSRRF